MESAERASILLVDDTPENLLALEATLSDMNLDLVLAYSGREALKWLLKKDFALVLLDIRMPDLDGFETAKLIRQRDRSKHTPIIFLTALYTEEKSITEGYALGAVDYIIRPYVPEVLKSKVEVFVDLFQKAEEIKRQSERLIQVEQQAYRVKLAAAKQKMELATMHIREEHRLAQAILEHSPMGIVKLSDQLKILELNETFCRTFCITPQHVLHQDLFEQLPFMPREPFVDALEHARQSCMDQFRVSMLSGMETVDRYFDLAVWPIKYGQEQPSGVVLLTVDVTERVRLTQQRDDFVATLAHDLQVPVVASERALELLLDNVVNLDDRHLQLGTMLKENNKNLLKMIQGLLDIYRYEAGVQALFFDYCHIPVLVRACIEELEPISQRLQVKIEYDEADDVPPAWADCVAIRRVLTNLLDNAIKFSPRGSTIKVSAETKDRMLITNVSNPGPGIPDEDVSQLFRRYWHKTTTRTYKDSCGLGLYLCKQIIEAHQGKIYCHSKENDLTTFTVELPIHKTAPSPSITHRNADAIKI